MTIYTIGPSDNLNAAVNNLNPGDTLRLLPGEYHDVVSAQLMGADNAPITIEAVDMNNRPVITGRAPRNLEEASLRGVDINYGLPQAKYDKRNMNKDSKTFGATGCTRALFNCKPDSGNYIIRGLILRDSLGRIWNHEATDPIYSKNITFADCVMEWARMQVFSIKRVGNIKFIRCEFSHGASFYQTTGRPKKGPQDDLQTHNATCSMGGCDGVEMVDCVVHDAHGEGLIASANKEPTLNGVIRNFTGYDCYRSPLYLHSPENWLVDNVLIYRSAENIAEQKTGHDDPALKTNGPNVQPSEGDKPYSNTAKNIVLQNVICSHTNSGLSLSGSLNTEPVSDITFRGCTVVNAGGFALSLKGNQPKRVKVVDNVFYHDDPNKELGFAYPNRYDGSSVIAENSWSKKPALKFLQGPGDKYGGFDVPIGSKPLPKGTLVEGQVPPPEPPIMQPDAPILDPLSYQDGMMFVSWEPQDDDVYYRLQWRFDGNNQGWQLIEQDITESELTYPAAAPGFYEVRVRKFDGAGWSDWSNVETITVPDEPTQPPPISEVEMNVEVGGVIWELNLTEDSINAIRHVWVNT